MYLSMVYFEWRQSWVILTDTKRRDVKPKEDTVDGKSGQCSSSPGNNKSKSMAEEGGKN